MRQKLPISILRLPKSGIRIASLRPRLQAFKSTYSPPTTIWRCGRSMYLLFAPAIRVSTITRRRPSDFNSFTGEDYTSESRSNWPTGVITFMKAWRSLVGGYWAIRSWMSTIMTTEMRNSPGCMRGFVKSWIAVYAAAWSTQTISIILRYAGCFGEGRGGDIVHGQISSVISRWDCGHFLPGDRQVLVQSPHSMCRRTLPRGWQRCVFWT